MALITISYKAPTSAAQKCSKAESFIIFKKPGWVLNTWGGKAILRSFEFLQKEESYYFNVVGSSLQMTGAATGKVCPGRVRSRKRELL